MAYRSEQSRRDRWRHPFWQGGSGPIIGAVLTVGFGIFALVLGNSGAVRQIVPGSPVQTVTTVVTTPTHTTPPVTSPTPVHAPPVARSSESKRLLRSGLVTLSDGFGINLDSKRKDWGVSTDCGEPADLCLLVGGIFIAPDGLNPGLRDSGIIAPVRRTEPSSLDTCERVTAYEEHISVPRLKSGLRACTKTTNGNLALVRIVRSKVDPDVENSALDLEVSVWRANY